MRMVLRHGVRVALAAWLSCAAALAQDAGSSDKPMLRGTVDAAAPAIADVPGDDIFGFSSPTDLGKPGDTGVASENSGASGKRVGTYGKLTTRLEFSRTFAENWWAAFSPFVTAHRIANVVGIPVNRNQAEFDGFSVELAHRFIERSATNPFAVTWLVEPRFSRVDGTSGTQLDAYSAELNVFVDAVVVPDRLYWALNMSYAPSVAQMQGDRSRWAAASGTSVSTALTLQATKQAFVGAEARYITAFGTAFLARKQGEAFFLGPTALYKITDKVAVNVVWTPQLIGHAKGVSQRLDLDNFERHQFRGKLVWQY